MKRTTPLRPRSLMIALSLITLTIFGVTLWRDQTNSEAQTPQSQTEVSSRPSAEPSKSSTETQTERAIEARVDKQRSDHSESEVLSVAPAETYELDALSREIPRRGKIKCPKLKLISYRGDLVRYHKPVTIHPAFKAKLKRFERLVSEVAIEVYGRAPKKIKHLGTYNCRRIGGYPNLLSEHSFGNGIDVAAFSFARLPRGESLPEGLHPSLKRAFSVNILKHWRSKRAGGAHKRFLHKLGHRLIESEIFRVLLGPSFPGHKNHFHLDYAPYELVSIFEN